MHQPQPSILARMAETVGALGADRVRLDDAYWDLLGGPWDQSKSAETYRAEADAGEHRCRAGERRYRHALTARRMLAQALAAQKVAAAVDRIRARGDRRRAHLTPTMAVLRRARRRDDGRPPGRLVAASPCRPTGPPVARAGAAT